MYRLFFLIIAVIFGYMLWRIVRVVTRGGQMPGNDGTTIRSNTPRTPARTYKDVKDAEFEDLKPGRSDGPAGPPGPAS
jgi:hypothetical protein